MSSSHHSRGRAERQLRIIAGRWRSRRFRFPELDIRPTPDRVRETLFNWLQDRIEGARCLDLYAGSGALGLEALSRGASEVVFVERERVAASALEALLRDWGAGGASVRCLEARRYLAQPPPSAGFELVFLDPPYGATEFAQAVPALERGWLAPQARIYVEHARGEPLPALPAHWRALRSGHAGEVGYHLFATGGSSAT